MNVVSQPIWARHCARQQPPPPAKTEPEIKSISPEADFSDPNAEPAREDTISPASPDKALQEAAEAAAAKATAARELAALNRQREDSEEEDLETVKEQYMRKKHHTPTMMATHQHKEIRDKQFYKIAMPDHLRAAYDRKALLRVFKPEPRTTQHVKMVADITARSLE